MVILIMSEVAFKAIQILFTNYFGRFYITVDTKTTSVELEFLFRLRDFPLHSFSKFTMVSSTLVSSTILTPVGGLGWVLDPLIFCVCSSFRSDEHCQKTYKTVLYLRFLASFEMQL